MTPGRAGREEAVTVVRLMRYATELAVTAVVLVAAAACTSGGSSAAGGSAGSGTAAEAVRGPAAAAPQDASAQPAQAPAPVDVGRSVVRTAQLAVEIDDPGAATRKVRAAVAGAGGSVAEEESTDGGSRLTLRVPAAALDRLIDDIAAFGHVTSRSGQAVDATDQMVDLNARVANQQASVVRVRALLARATSIGDIVAIESELSRREADLDSLTNRLAALRDRVALSTLTVDIAKTPLPAGTPPSAGFLGGLATGWDGLRVVAAAVGVAAGFLLPFLLVLAGIAGVLWLGRLAVRARRVPAVAGARGGPGPGGES